MISAVDRPPIDSHRSRRLPDDARQELYQRALAGAVLAEDRMDIAPRKGQRDVVEGDCLAIALREASDL